MLFLFAWKLLADKQRGQLLIFAIRDFRFIWLSSVTLQVGVSFSTFIHSGLLKQRLANVQVFKARYTTRLGTQGLLTSISAPVTLENRKDRLKRPHVKLGLNHLVTFHVAGNFANVLLRDRSYVVARLNAWCNSRWSQKAIPLTILGNDLLFADITFTGATW